MAAPNLLLVIIDALRADRLGYAGLSRARTPFLDSLAARSVIYDNCRSVCGWTLPACASIVTGQPPSVHGLIHHDRRFERPKIPGVLGRDWATFGVGNNGNLVPDDISDEELAAQGFSRRPDVWKRFGWQEGFETYRWFHKEDKAGPFTAFREWFSARARDPRPWFAMLHTNLVHDYDHDDPWCLDVTPFLGRPLNPALAKFRDGPFIWKDPPLGLSHDDLREELLAKYDAGVAECDRRLAAALTNVDLDTTCVVIVSDHGEGFDGAAERVHHCGRLHEDLLRVPLLVSYPEGTKDAPKRGTRVSLSASVLDVAKTMLAVGGRDEASLPGMDLRALPETRTLHLMDFGYLYPPRSAATQPFRRYDYTSHDLSLTGQVDVAKGRVTKRIAARIGRQAWNEEYDLISDPLERVNRALGVQSPLRRPERDEGAVAAAWRDWKDAIEVPTVLDDPDRWNAFARRHHSERRLPTTSMPPADNGAPLTFIAAVDDPAEFRRHGAASRVFVRGAHQWLLIENGGNRAYSSISRLYSDAARRAEHDIICYVHQDVFFPPDFETRLSQALAQLTALDANWGVVGVAGRAPETQSGEEPPNIGHWSDPHKYHKAEVALPAEVQILDELLLITRRGSGLSFDPEMPGFHCYGADLCLAARAEGMKSYVVDAPVVHKLFRGNGALLLRADHAAKVAARATERFRVEFNRSADFVRAKWAKHLPFRGTAHHFER